MNGGKMSPISRVNYAPQLASLIALVKSSTPEGDYVMGVLQEGDEDRIRYMLKNFGNVATSEWEWQHFTMVQPWTDFQINAAVADLDTMQPPEQVSAKFWAW